MRYNASITTARIIIYNLNLIASIIYDCVFFFFRLYENVNQLNVIFQIKSVSLLNGNSLVIIMFKIIQYLGTMILFYFMSNVS